MGSVSKASNIDNSSVDPLWAHMLQHDRDIQPPVECPFKQLQRLLSCFSYNLQQVPLDIRPQVTP